MEIKSVKICSPIILAVFLLAQCSPAVKQNNPVVTKGQTTYGKGTYGYDLSFFEGQKIQTIELKDEQSKARLFLVPAYQGRVMTSSANGNDGLSFGWINYELIQSGEIRAQFNPVGGEERLCIGPEGGPFSICFQQGKEQVFSNWKMHKEVDTEAFDLITKTSSSVTFSKEFALTNASGTNLKMGVGRMVKLLSKTDAEQALQFPLDSLDFVAFESENELTNKGETAWTEKSGFLSIWMLSMFTPAEKGVVFIPFKTGSEADMGKIVTDDYFGKVPADRLIVKEDILFFKTDGKMRTKIGISPKRAMPWLGSYDPDKQALTLLWYSKPETAGKYVNSKWGHQDDPLSGDVVNSYNDGPVADGSMLGPFYEMESSSPAAMLSPGEKITHTQRIFHITGDEAQLSKITVKLFNVPVSEIKRVF